MKSVPFREIASALDMASTTVFRRLKKTKENNITIPTDIVSSTVRLQPHIDITDLLIRWRQNGDAGTAGSVVNSGISSDNSPDSAAQSLNSVLLQIQRYISPEHYADVLALIEDFDLEVVGVGRMK